MTNAHPHNEFSWKRAALISLGAGLLAVSLSIILQTHGVVVSAYSLPQPVYPIALSGPESSGTSYRMPGKPVRLIIPSIGVDANIQSVGLGWKDTGNMGVPTNFTDVAWYKDGPLPGMPGSAVIDGHLDGKSVAQAVFYNLDKLLPGDLVEVVDAQGTILQFRVVDTKYYAYDATTTEIFAGDASVARLNLITCAGDWMKSAKLYDKRIVVFTELVTK